MAGDRASARRLLDQAEAATTGLENDVSAMLMLLQARALGASKFQIEYAAGQQLSRAGAITLALGESAQPVAAHTDTADTAPLGSREAEVAQLVAEGSSNKQIGTRLFISERTVDSHVRSILNKLGVNSRAQIAVWVRSAGR